MNLWPLPFVPRYPVFTSRSLTRRPVTDAGRVWLSAPCQPSKRRTTMRTNWQVCSLVVQAKSQNIAAIGTQLNTLPGCEVALSDVESGQLIVVAEADQSETLMQTIESVRNVEGVLAVSLVYHQQDEQGEETP
ncbi:Periplasmic nitrate reductase component NapD [Salmonella enterica subsp. enterica serovar Typhimurium]|nr:Periplasmic nitrate reductase component NapD [Salmonella enterica subsp. enterica serovar Typhimurium]